MNWVQIHIKPQNVLVRQAEGEEIIERDGVRIPVPIGNYIIKDEQGKLWQCNPTALDQAYVPGRFELTTYIVEPAEAGT